MASIRYVKYSRGKFKDWQSRVRKHLPEIVKSFYDINANDTLPLQKHKLLGSVIKDINNPLYAIVDECGHRTEYENEIIAEVLLQLNVCELFALVKTIKPSCV